MIPLALHLDTEQNPLPQDGLVADGMLTDIGLLRHGTHRGKAVVGLVVTMPDGTRVIGQTTWALFRTAYVGLAASPIVAEEVIDP